MSKIVYIALAAGLNMIQLNDYYYVLPDSMDFDYLEGGEDWGEGCHQTVQESPIDINQRYANYTQANEENSALVPLVFTNPRIRNFTEISIAGTRNYFVFSGTAAWNLTRMSPSKQVLMDVHVTAPAEHLFNGQRYALEVQLRYGLPRPTGLLMPISYVGIWVQAGAYSQVIQDIINSDLTDLSPLFPASGVLNDYYYYTGSETRPVPICVPDLAWVIPNYVLQASPNQIAYFTNQYADNFSFAGGRGNVRDPVPMKNTLYHFKSLQSPSQSFLFP